MADPAQSPGGNAQSINKILSTLSNLKLESESQQGVLSPRAEYIGPLTKSKQWPQHPDDWKNMIYQIEESGDFNRIHSLFDVLL